MYICIYIYTTIVISCSPFFVHHVFPARRPTAGLAEDQRACVSRAAAAVAEKGSKSWMNT